MTNKKRVANTGKVRVPKWGVWAFNLLLSESKFKREVEYAWAGTTRAEARAIKSVLVKEYDFVSLFRLEGTVTYNHD